jgi:hypothetical protein
MRSNIISCDLCHSCEPTVYEIFKNKTLCEPCLKKIKLKYIKVRRLIHNIAEMHFWLTEIAVYKTKTKNSEKKHLVWANQQLKVSMRKINRNLIIMRKVYPEIKWQNH